MHAAAREYVAEQVATFGPWRRACEVGSRFINGGIRDLFLYGYVGVDIAPGPGVDVVADFADWDTDDRFDVIVCCEVFEHTARWPEIIERAYALLADDGLIIITAAGPGRPTHSAHDGGDLRPGEHYANVDPADLAAAHGKAGFSSVVVDVAHDDVRSIGFKRKAAA